MWDAIVPAVTAIVGSAVGFLSQALLEHEKDKSAWKRTCGEYKIREYFSCIDSYSKLRVSFSEIGKATSGRKRLEDCLSEEEKDEMRERDRRAASAVDRCWGCLDEAHGATNRLCSIGANRVMEDYRLIENLINGYFVDAYHVAMENNGLFVASRHQEALEELDKRIDSLILHARADLEVAD